MGAPDATKVRVHGPGIEHGVLATFQSRFMCDTRGAGAGQLTVRVRGPKGNLGLISLNYSTLTVRYSGILFAMVFFIVNLMQDFIY
jgi:hypothetical protein